MQNCVNIGNKFPYLVNFIRKELNSTIWNYSDHLEEFKNYFESREL